ncbi:MAG: sigma-54-dependent Fis family transcriptional regulator, partial [Holophagales bacterium]|nr:sigma-54-dependent Fis family transcriptional regulator [Holophagales bacterium]
KAFELPLGELTLGVSQCCAIRLPVTGVSRRHARLRVSEEGLEVEDLSSKNGTFVEGSRIRSAAVGDGERIEFGPVELRVESLAEGGDLAICFDPSPPESESPGALPTETPALDRLRALSGELSLIQDLLPKLAASTGDPALRAVTETLALDGACLVEWTPEGEAVVLSSWGTLGQMPGLEQIRGLPRELRDDGHWRTGLVESDPRGLLVACSPSRGGRDAGWCAAPVGLFLCASGGDPLARISSDLARILLLLLVPSLAEHAEREKGESRDPPAPVVLDFPEGYVVASSPRMEELYRQLEALCGMRQPVLLHGETGVGKELLARTLHRSSSDPSRPYVVVSCAAIPESLLEAEMFGVARGAATGIEAREGYFARAEGGTLFLDEIGELALPLQAKLLRALQEKEIQPVGGKPRTIDVWVIAATHVNLHGDRLRRDLYFRLAGGLLEVPPLRECVEDIPGLVRHFLATMAGQAGVPLRGMTARALARLQAHGWPGNVRELEHVLRRLVWSHPVAGIVDEADLPPALLDAVPETVASPEECPAGELKLKPRVEVLERRLITEAMRRSRGRQTRAARLLGVSRSGLAKMLDRLNLRNSWIRSAGPDVRPR